jgi:hypothetical protein
MGTVPRTNISNEFWSQRGHLFSFGNGISLSSTFSLISIIEESK